MPINDPNLRFRVDLEDNATPKLQRLQEQLKKAGYTKSEIKMVMHAVDEATPKVKEAQRHIDRLPKEHKMRFYAQDEVTPKLQKLQAEAAKPVKITFLDNLKETTDKLFNLRSKAALPAGLPGSNMLVGVGGGAGALGAAGAAFGVIQQGVQVNAKMEQSLITLNQTLKDQSDAMSEMGKLVQIAQQTPFQYSDVLAADVRLRQYGIPTQQGEGGPNNQGWLGAAGNMAAAMNTPITQAVEAIADARQGYFIRMMSYGIRMMREDFQAGGKYAGQTYEQGLAQAIRRFEGAMVAQSKTFTGVVSNIKDIVEQQVIRPIGAPAFEAVRGGAQQAMSRLQDPQFQAQLGSQIEKVQHGMVDIYNSMRKARQTFQEQFLGPLIEIGKHVASIGATFGKTFGGVFLEVLRTVATMFTNLMKPVTAFISAHPQFVQVYAVFKAMSILGFGGPIEGLTKMRQSIFSMRPSLFGLIDGMHKFISGTVKMGLFAVVAGFEKAHEAASNLKGALRGLKAEDQFKAVNAQISEMAHGLDQSTNSMKNLAAQAMKGLQKGGTVQTGLYQARVAAHLQDQYGIDASQANILMSRHGIKSNADVDEAGKALRNLKAAADELHVSFKTAVRVMQMFGGKATPVGLGGATGGAYLTAMSETMGQQGFLTEQQTSKGIYSRDELMRRVLSSYRHPSVDAIRGLGNRFQDIYHFDPTAITGPLHQAGPFPGLQLGQAESMDARTRRGFRRIEDIRDRYQANVRGEETAQADFDRLGRRFGAPSIRLPRLADPGAAATLPNLQNIISARSPQQFGERLASAMEQARKNIKDLTPAIDEAQKHAQTMETSLANWARQTERLSWRIQALQHSFVPLQRAIEDQQFSIQKLTFEAMRPLERQMSRLNQESSVMSNRMSNAQYSMSKWTSGLVEGEQAALDNIHAMEMYNKQLQLIQLQHQQIGAQLGRTTYERGMSSRVAPLMGLNMQMQMERLQRRQQMAQLQYDIGPGEQHYQIGQAARSRFERQELPYEQRLQGVKDNVKVIDDVSEAQHKMQNVQFDLQTRMFHVNENIQDQQDALQRLQQTLTDKQLHGGMRALEDESYALGRKTQVTQTHLNELNQRIDKMRDRITDYRDVQEVLAQWFDLATQFDKDDKLKGVRNALDVAVAERLLSPAQAQRILDAAKRVDATVHQTEDKTWKPGGDAENTITRAIRGAFTGDTWRGLSDRAKNMPGFPGMIAPAIGPGGTVATLGATALVGIPAAVHLLRQALRGGLNVAGTAMPERFDRYGNAIRRGAGGIYRAREAVGTRLPGFLGRWVRPSPEGSLGRLADAGPFREITRAIGGGGFKEGLVEATRFIRRFRGLAGGAAGAAIGGMVGGPVGSLLGGMLGARWARGTTVREAATETKALAKELRHPLDLLKRSGEDHVKAAREFVHSSTIGREASVTFHTASGHVRTQVQHMGEHVRRMGPEAEKIGKEAGKIGEEAKKMHGGRFAGAIALFAATIEGFKEWGQHNLPGFRHEHRPPPNARGHKEPEAHAPDAAHEPMPHQPAVSGEHAAEEAEHLERTNPAFRRAVEAARRGGKRSLIWGGKALRITGRVAGVLGFAPAAASLVQQDYGKAATQAINAGSYLIPGVGDVRMGYDIMDLLMGHPGRAGNYRDPEARRRILRAEHLSPMQTYLAHHPDAAGTLVAKDEAQVLTQNQMMQGRIADRLNTKGIDPKEYDRLLKRLTDLQNDYDKKYKLALDSNQNEAKRMIEKHYDDREKDQDASQKASLRSLQTYYDDHNNVTSSSLSKTFKIADDHLRKMHHRVNSAQKEMFRSLDSAPPSAPGTSDAAAAPDPGGGTANDYHRSGGDRAHGGFPPQHIIKGKGDSRGYLLRVGEEDDELIIPLAPHRRERARSLVKHAQGMLGGFANGGPVAQISAADKKTQRSAMAVLRKAWKYAAPLFGQDPKSKMPNTGFNFSKDFDAAGDTITPELGWNLSHINLSKVTAQELQDRDPEGVATALHEWVHYFQKGLNRNMPLIEGGAELFTSKHLKPLLRKMKGFDRDLVGDWNSTVYKNEQELASKMGDHWLNSSQFGFASGGDVKRFGHLAEQAWKYIIHRTPGDHHIHTPGFSFGDVYKNQTTAHGNPAAGVEFDRSSGPQIVFDKGLIDAVNRKHFNKFGWQALQTIMHEMVHARQHLGASSREREGGAEEWTRHHLRDFAHKFGLNLPHQTVRNYDSTPEYSKYAAWVRKHKGEHWINQGQFAAGGMIEPRTPGVDTAYLTAKGAYQRASASFAQGGFTGPFGTLAGMIPIANLAKKFGLSVSAGRTNHSHLTTTGNVSDHSWGGALDVSNGILTPQEDAFAQFVKSKLRPILGQLIWRNVIQAGRSTGFPVPGHENHVHVALARAWADNEEAVAKFISRVEKGMSVKQLVAQVGTFAGDAGGAATNVLAGVHLPAVPRSLKGRGVVGHLMYKVLQKLRSNVRAHAASAAGDVPGGGGAMPNIPTGGAAKKIIGAAAKAVGIPPGILWGIYGAESNFGNIPHAQSGAGAQGPFQFMPGTADTWVPGGRKNVWHLREAAVGAARYLKSLYSMFKDWPAAVGHYNSGPGGNLSNPETAAYIPKVMQFAHSYATGKDRVQLDNTPALLHKGERVLTPAQASHADSSEARWRATKKSLDTVEEIRDYIKKMTGHLSDMKDKGDKQKDTDRLSQLNTMLRSRLEAHPAAATGRAPSNIIKWIKGMGDDTGGEGTQAMVTTEKGSLKNFIDAATKKITESHPYKEAVREVHAQTRRTEGVQRLAHGRHSPGGARVTHAEHHTIALQQRAQRSAARVPALIRRLGRETGRASYLHDAAGRGISRQVVERATGHALSHRRVTVGRPGHTRQLSEARAYRVAAGARPGSQAQTRALRDLRAVLSKGLGATRSEISKARATASRDSKRAESSIRKTFGKHGADLIKHTAAGHKAISSSVRSSGRVTASAAKAAGHHTAAQLTAAHEKGHQIARSARDETKGVKGETRKADDKRTKQEIANDRRDRDHQKHVAHLLEQLLQKDTAINIHNEAHGATLASTVVKSRRRPK